MAVRFFGPVSNSSGYGSAVANFAKAFSLSGVKTQYCFSKSAESSLLLSQLEHYSGKTNTDFYLHCPPYTKHKSLSYKIAYFYWEADRLPNTWIRGINKVDELWLPCDLVKNACLRANFRGKIRVVPTPCENWISNSKLFIPAPFSNRYRVSDSTYKFYSIFQWHNRKGPRELLTAYYRTFTENDNVLLILKVNPLGVQGYTREKIKIEILELKRKLNLKYYPPIYLIDSIISKENIRAIHQTGDCYVSPHHGEGWGVPIHEAMMLGKQIIVTKFGGVTEYLDNSSAHIIKHKLVPVSGMEWSPLYQSNQNWAGPSINHLSNLMRDVYENHDNYSDKGIRSKKIAETMTIEAVAEQISKIFREM